jgi:DNA-binding transcriptional ArsR family regulator
MRPSTFHGMEIDIAPIAGLLSDRARVAMLWAVSDGRHMPASTLAETGHVSPSAATAHLSKLVAAGLLAVERKGRQRLYRLANPAVVAALEALAAVPPAAPPDVQTPSPLSLARTCYDHLAGALGVRVTDVLIARGALRLEGDAYAVTSVDTFTDLGIDMRTVGTGTRRAFARPCLDWSERRYHLAGALGAALTTRWLEEGWLARSPLNRAVSVTSHGRRGFRHALGIIVDLALR